MTEAELAARYPAIPWRTPILVKRTDGADGYGCRFCIALYGLKGSDIHRLPQTIGEWEEHMALLHAAA